jgi:TolB-like protein/Flp pilus assembly protein TadD
MPEGTSDARLEIAHVLFMDIVGWSKLLINQQSELLRRLNEIVRSSAQVRAAESAGKLIRLPTGDGMALAFFTTPDAPLRCAVEIGKELKKYPDLLLRMGIHSGPVDEVVDVNERANIAGAGITIAQRVMDCGNAGHILLSRRAADDLGHYGLWREHLHDLGECDVKHALRLGVVNFYNDEVGNPALPEKFKEQRAAPMKAERDARSPRGRRALLVGSAVLAVLLLIAGLWLFLRRAQQSRETSATALSTPFGQRIAVLPFKPLVPENRDQVLEFGMADTLITKLSNSRQLIVSSLPSVRRYGGLDQDPVAAGRQLQVNSVVEGNVQRSGDQIRVTVRLINVSDGTSIWAGTFDEKFTDVFTVQDTISRKVADALAVRLTGEEQQRLTRRYTDNVTAYQLYMTGRYQWAKLTPGDITKSIDFFKQAIEKDPSYALAYFGLAESYRALAINADVPSKDCLPASKDAARKAIELDRSLSEAHSALSFGMIWYDWDWSGAEEEARRAIVLNPNSAHAHFGYAHVLSDLARHDEAIAQIRQARELDPVFPLYRSLEGMFLLHAGRNEEALAKLRTAAELDPNFWVTHLMLGRVYIQQRKYAEAIEELSQARDLSHGNSEAIGSIGYAAALAGDKASARTVLDELKTLSSQRYIPPHNIALVYNGLGDQDQALAELDKACDERDVRVTLLKVDPRWDSLRSNPRFLGILKRIGLP